MGPADRAPFGLAGGGDRTKSGSRRSTRAVYPASELSGEITLLLLLWWIDGGMSVVTRSTLARQGLPRGRSDYTRMVAQVHQLSNPSYECHGPPSID